MILKDLVSIICFHLEYLGIGQINQRFCHKLGCNCTNSLTCFFRVIAKISPNITCKQMPKNKWHETDTKIHWILLFANSIAHPCLTKISFTKLVYLDLWCRNYRHRLEKKWSEQHPWKYIRFINKIVS